VIQRNVKVSRQNINTTSVLQHTAILWVVILLCGSEAQGVNNAQKKKIVSRDYAFRKKSRNVQERTGIRMKCEENQEHIQ
jgi:hypothetical protein